MKHPGGWQRLASGLLPAVLILGALTGIARADDIDDLRAEVDQLRSQVTLMQNQIPGASADNGAGGSGTIAAQQVVQMQQLSQQMSQLQGQIEQLGIKVDDLNDRFTRAQKDTEFRLGQLEQGGGATGAAAAGTSGGLPAADAGATLPTPQMGAAQAATVAPGAPQPLVGPEGTQAPTLPGTLGTLTAEQAANLPQAPAGAAEAAAAAAAASTPSPAALSQDPKSIVLPGNNPQEQYDYATGLLQRSAYAEAELALKAFVAQHPNDALTGNAQYWLGESYYARSDFKNAASAFAEGYQKYPKSPKAPDNLLKLGMALGQTGQKDNACIAFRQLGKQFPNASAAIKDRAARAQTRYGCTG